MKVEELTDKEHLRSFVQESIRKQVNEKEEGNLNESFGGLLLVLGAVGAGFAALRELVKGMFFQQTFKKFIEEEDSNNVVNKKLPQTIKKANLVGSLSDLNQFEESADQIVRQLENLESRVDPFIEKTVSEEPSWLDKAFILNPVKYKRQFKKELQKFIKTTRESFEYTIEQKRDEILS